MQSRSLNVYSKEIQKYNLIGQEKERQLIKDSSGGCVRSRDELITANLYLVLKIANKYKDMGVDFDELVCEGNKGLTTAATRFNPSMDNKFSTYAYFWIRQAMLASLEDNRKGWSPTSGENILNYDSYSEQELSVDMYSFEESVEDRKINDIVRAIDGLPARDSSIVKHYFGISGFTEMNTVELSKKYKISAMRVSAIIENSIKKIRCEIITNTEE